MFIKTKSAILNGDHVSRISVVSDYVRYRVNAYIDFLQLDGTTETCVYNIALADSREDAEDILSVLFRFIRENEDFDVDENLIDKEENSNGSFNSSN